MNTSILISFVIVALCALSANASPVVESFAVEDSPVAAAIEAAAYEPALAPHGDRHRRVTCDLLSVSTKWGALNHSACAAHCLSMRNGYRGGRCINGVCNCRK